ncbi:hypothetical protein, partial [Streptomyces spectabilis]|uniref:hypothetical protein n=1 Tax=Streptomyces spectabilis TaxID=68270 RepID=UPI001E5178E9
ATELPGAGPEGRQSVILCGCVTGLSRVSLLLLDLYGTVLVCGDVFAGVTDMGGVWCHLGDDGRVGVLQIPERVGDGGDHPLGGGGICLSDVWSSWLC